MKKWLSYDELERAYRSSQSKNFWCGVIILTLMLFIIVILLDGLGIKQELHDCNKAVEYHSE